MEMLEFWEKHKQEPNITGYIFHKSFEFPVHSSTYTYKFHKCEFNEEVINIGFDAVIEFNECVFKKDIVVKDRHSSKEIRFNICSIETITSDDLDNFLINSTNPTYADKIAFLIHSHCSK